MTLSDLFNTLHKTLNYSQQQNRETEEIIAANPGIFLLENNAIQTKQYLTICETNRFSQDEKVCGILDIAVSSKDLVAEDGEYNLR